MPPVQYDRHCEDRAATVVEITPVSVSYHDRIFSQHAIQSAGHQASSSALATLNLWVKDVQRGVNRKMQLSLSFHAFKSSIPIGSGVVEGIGFSVLIVQGCAMQSVVAVCADHFAASILQLRPNKRLSQAC